MDCYSGRNFEELVVPNYQESSSETYPSSGMWAGWSMSSPEAAEKCFDYDMTNDGFSGGGLLYSQMGMRTCEEEEEESKRSKAFYGVSSLQDFEGIEQMDDIFLYAFILSSQISFFYFNLRRFVFSDVIVVFSLVSGFNEEVQFWRMFQGMMEMFTVHPAAITVLVLPLCMVVGKSLCFIAMICLSR